MILISTLINFCITSGLLTKEQIKGVFINLDELITVNSEFSEKLQDALDIATEQGDEVSTNCNYTHSIVIIIDSH